LKLFSVDRVFEPVW